MEKSKIATQRQPASAQWSRRALISLLPAIPSSLLAAAGNTPVRLGISESLVGDVNLNDARASMQIWLRKMSEDLNVVIEMNPRVFESTRELQTRARNGQLDAVALNVIEYRQIADVLDSTQVIIEAGASGKEQYLLLAKRAGPIRNLGDLRGRRLAIFKAPKMCIAPAWLTNVLHDGRFGPGEEFFASITTETKCSRVVLPVFFGQTEACLTSKRGFDTMCELNPQLARDLTVITSSPPLVVTFYIFHRNYHGVNREKFVKVYTSVPASVAGRQLATLFQFEALEVKDATCLATSLAVLEKSDHIQKAAGAARRTQ